MLKYNILVKVFSEYFCFPCQSLNRLFHTHHHPPLSRAVTIGKMVADVPSGLNATPHQEGKIFSLLLSVFEVKEELRTIPLERLCHYTNLHDVRIENLLNFGEGNIAFTGYKTGHSPSARQPRNSTRRQTVRLWTL
jgi:hypothetical protein